jgi:hypothetical protein
MPSAGQWQSANLSRSSCRGTRSAHSKAAQTECPADDAVSTLGSSKPSKTWIVEDGEVVSRAIERLRREDSMLGCSPAPFWPESST